MCWSKWPELWRFFITSRYFIEIWRFPSPYLECQCLPYQGRISEVGRYECQQNRQKWSPLHTNWHSLLCKSRSLERSTLWLKVWYLVIWLCYLRNDNFVASFQGIRHGRTFLICHWRNLSANSHNIFKIIIKRDKVDASAKPNKPAKYLKIVKIIITFEKGKRTQYRRKWGGKFKSVTYNTNS